MSTTASNVLSPTDGVTSALARYSSELRYEDLDARSIAIARHCLLDWIGVAIGGAQDDTTRIMRDVALDAGGTPQASIVCSERSSMLQAVSEDDGGTWSPARRNKLICWTAPTVIA